VHTGHDAAYTNDNLNRLTQAEEGTWTGSAITSRTRDQQWTLSQTGNWEMDKLDLDGDDNWNESGEHQDDRTHNAVNELTARDVDDDGTDEFALAYDAAGNLTDDGEAYTYEWDAFYRLRRVVNRETQNLVAEYWYNGLGYLLTRHQDTDTDGDVDANDKKFHTAYDERWRPVAVYRESDSEPKERFLYHAAGWGGYGTSSYIDTVVLRDRDANSGWTAASDGTLEERVYHVQNWKADVVALVKVGDQMQEWVKYSAYGVPFGIPGGDTDSDGDCDATDVTQVQTWIDGATYDIRGDIDLDGDVDATDKSTIQSSFLGTTLGRGSLSASGVRNRKGYAGYEFDVAIGQKYHVRHRVLDSALGRWVRRDPLHLNNPFLYEYAYDAPIPRVDPDGRQTMGMGSLITTVRRLGTAIAAPFMPSNPSYLGHHGPFSNKETDLWKQLSVPQQACVAACAGAASIAGAAANAQGHDGNCIRHCTLACCATYCAGPGWTWAFLTAHEDHTNYSDRAEDEKSNLAGIFCAASWSWCDECCEQYCH
jgi:RHS repeat-associated protein